MIFSGVTFTAVFDGFDQKIPYNAIIDALLGQGWSIHMQYLNVSWHIANGVVLYSFSVYYKMEISIYNQPPILSAMDVVSGLYCLHVY